jgi:hypothetical protein
MDTFYTLAGLYLGCGIIWATIMLIAIALVDLQRQQDIILSAYAGYWMLHLLSWPVGLWLVFRQKLPPNDRPCA